ncbi:Transposon Ty3-I Gag-Pol polyprotein [Vitis vinifera]|uniref:Transposon Ty3-I Gag-Pol polyprotein n=1 Tax=Vitis vinifera TaxID=29760 RepID=A0A438C9B7_VITVI|nr:Transposon Ty3-I Gag-Pol polyprotein [Vitis vinifera]
MAPKRTQVVHVNKCNDKIITAQSTHDTATSPMTRSKAKSTSSISTKQTSESACLLKQVRTHDEHQPLITLVSLGAKSHSPRSKGKLPSTLQDFGDKSPCSVIEANSSTGSHSGSPTGMSKKENYSNRSNSFTFPFSMTILVMATDTTSIEEQLAEMARVIAKLTKTVEKKDMQITSLINKVEAQVQNTGIDGDLLVKQFVHSLRGNAFDWYIDLAPKCIDSWDQMKREFLNHFYNTRRTVNMMEITNTKKWKDESVVDYINRWRSLSLECKDRLSEVIELPECKHPEEMGRVNDPNLQLISRDETQKSVKSSRDQTKQEFFLGELSLETTGEKMHGLNETQKKLKQQGYAVKPSRAGLGFVPFEPIKILAKTKKTKANTQHITVEDMENISGSNSPPRISVFDQIKAPITRASVFTSFIRKVKYPTWISNIVPVKKKNGQIHVCVDFRDLNNACLKYDIPLPIMELMIDATTGHEALSFMDGSSGYNQIQMALRDEELIAFRTPKGIYYYKVMSFGLKNAGATYQRVMQKIFHDMLYKNVECYVNDLVVKSRKR